VCQAPRDALLGKEKEATRARAFLVSAAGAIVAAMSVLLIPGRGRETAADMQPAAASA
jgi:hypothetical protein